MNPIKAIISDADGTLIENDNLYSTKPELKSLIQKARNEGILFNLASGRPLRSQKILYHLLIEPDIPKPKEAILYEGAALKFFGRDDVFVSGRLFPEEMKEINAYLKHNNLLSNFVPNTGHEFGLGFVTEQFYNEKVTDENFLQRTYIEIRDVLELQFPYLEVTRSRDAIDIAAKGITKADPTKKYSELTGIRLSNMVVFGDSWNDKKMLEIVSKGGGLAVYVGEDKELLDIVRNFENNFIPQYTGPKGTIQGLEYILKINSTFSR